MAAQAVWPPPRPREDDDGTGGGTDAAQAAAARLLRGLLRELIGGGGGGAVVVATAADADALRRGGGGTLPPALAYALAPLSEAQREAHLRVALRSLPRRGAAAASEDWPRALAGPLGGCGIGELNMVVAAAGAAAAVAGRAASLEDLVAGAARVSRAREEAAGLGGAVHVTRPAAAGAAAAALWAPAGAGAGAGDDGGGLLAGTLTATAAWGGVAGYGAEKRALVRAVVWPIRLPSALLRLSDAGAQPPLSRGSVCGGRRVTRCAGGRGVVLCGPPGCGKSSVPRALAGIARVNFVAVKGTALLCRPVPRGRAGRGRDADMPGASQIPGRL